MMRSHYNQSVFNGSDSGSEIGKADMDKIRIMEASVEKWNRIIAGESSDGGVVDCPPCRIFYVLVCFGCPIAEYTGYQILQRHALP